MIDFIMSIVVWTPEVSAAITLLYGIAGLVWCYKNKKNAFFWIACAIQIAISIATVIVLQLILTD